MKTDRGQGLIWVIIWLITILFSLWIFTLIAGSVLEPMRDLVLSFDSTQDSGYASAINLFWPILVKWAPLLLGVGAILLTILYAAWRERFTSRRRVP